MPARSRWALGFPVAMAPAVIRLDPRADAWHDETTAATPRAVGWEDIGVGGPPVTDHF